MAETVWVYHCSNLSNNLISSTPSKKHLWISISTLFTFAFAVFIFLCVNSKIIQVKQGSLSSEEEWRKAVCEGKCRM